MDTRDSVCLFAAIDAFLCADAERRSAVAFWSTKPVISRDEVGVLKKLAEQPLPVEALAPMLARELCDARRLLDAMVAVGILDRSGDLYACSESTILYCHRFLPPVTLEES